MKRLRMCTLTYMFWKLETVATKDLLAAIDSISLELNQIMCWKDAFFRKPPDAQVVCLHRRFGGVRIHFNENTQLLLTLPQKLKQWQPWPRYNQTQLSFGQMNDFLMVR